MTANGYELSFWVAENVLELDGDSFCKYAKIASMINSNQANFTACEIYISNQKINIVDIYVLGYEE